MRKIRLDENGTILYSSVPHPENIAIFSHSLSANYTSGLALYIMEKLYRDGVGIVVFDFVFFKNKSTPSPKLSNETSELEKILSLVRENIHPGHISLIGKSLGGIISANLCSKNGLGGIDSLFIIGFPFKLGFPPNLKLLNEKNPVLPDYVAEYGTLFDKIKLPVTIIQGTHDDLGGIEECRAFFKKYSNCTLREIPGATHGFTSPVNKEINYFKGCADLISIK